MSPKAQDPHVRSALIEAAARLLAEHGPDALTTRRLAAEVGASTMAVYTYFAGMEELRKEVAREGFRRLAAYLDAVPDSDDPIFDLSALGGAYFINALTNYDLYRFMFLENPEDDDVGEGTFERLVRGVQRAIDAGRFDAADPLNLATQLWVMAHGVVTLHKAGCLTLDEAITTMRDMALNLFVGFGDDEEAARKSMTKAQDLFLNAGVQQPAAHAV
ncbi:MAG: TetR/AcrR family transcriptional regulator [Actinobacteria bacterium]|nr:TetR/AcrR family transcriptional regulator [Actinomycetota bacterium]